MLFIVNFVIMNVGMLLKILIEEDLLSIFGDRDFGFVFVVLVVVNVIIIVLMMGRLFY